MPDDRAFTLRQQRYDAIYDGARDILHHHIAHFHYEHLSQKRGQIKCGRAMNSCAFEKLCDISCVGVAPIGLLLHHNTPMR